MTKLKLLGAALALAIPGIMLAAGSCCTDMACCKDSADCCKERCPSYRRGRTLSIAQPTSPMRDMIRPYALASRRRVWN